MIATRAEREARLAAVGHNPTRLAPRDVPHDLFSDVPHRVLVPERSAHDASPDDVVAALRPLTGDAHVALATRGRAAELALVEALELSAPHVVHAGLFSTTQTALTRRGATLEDVPLADVAGRIARGGVHVAYVELANNGNHGHPVSVAELRAIRDACDRAGAKLLVDGCRALVNGDAAACLALADAFTISCAKEFLVPVGAVIGARDPAVIGRANALLFRAGTSLGWIDPPQQRTDLYDGVRYVLAHPEVLEPRRALLAALAQELVGRGVAVVEPVTAHAVYVPIDDAIVPHGNVAAMLSMMAHLYIVGGVRAQVIHTRRGQTIRLAMPLATSFDPVAIAHGVAASLASLAERPTLRLEDGVDFAFFRPLVR